MNKGRQATVSKTRWAIALGRMASMPHAAPKAVEDNGQPFRAFSDADERTGADSAVP